MKEVAHAVESSAEAREIVAEIRMMMGILKDEFAKEEAVALRPAQLVAVKAAVALRSHPAWKQPWVIGGFATAAAAAAIVLAVVAPSLFKSPGIDTPPIPQAVARPPQPVPSLPEPVRQLPQKSDGKTSAPDTNRMEKDAATDPRSSVVLRAPDEDAPVVPHFTPPWAQSFVEGGQAVAKTAAPPVGEVRPSAECPMEVCFGGPVIGWPIPASVNREAHNRAEDSPFQSVLSNPLATFSIHVDTASYTNVRRFLNRNQLPPKDAVRIEELINYFDYDYASPAERTPIAVYPEVAPAPWEPTHELVRIGLKARDVDEKNGTPGPVVQVVKDVKIQVDFNPSRVAAYRLIGYENRGLQSQDFNDDTKDSGDMRGGHTVTALFEIVPQGVKISGVDASKYQQPAIAASSNELLTVRVRYKLPDATESIRLDVPLVRPFLTEAERKRRTLGSTDFDLASADFRFAAAVAEFGMILRDSPYKGQASMDQTIGIAEQSEGDDKNGSRDPNS